MEGPASSVRLRKVASQLPCTSWRADEADKSHSKALQLTHQRQITKPRATSTLATVGLELVVQSRDGAGAGPMAMTTAGQSAWRLSL